MKMTSKPPTPNEFDQFKDTYSEGIEKSLSFTGQSHDFFIRIKTDYLLRHLEPLFDSERPLQVLDLGCGHGLAHSYLTEKAGNRISLFGIDPAVSVIEEARRNNPNVTYAANDGNIVPYSDNYFDVVQAVCVLHHVPPIQWEDFMREIYRILKPGGRLFIFEHNPYNPLTLYIVKTCPLDENAVLLNDWTMQRLFRSAGFSEMRRDFIIFFPFDKPVFRKLENRLAWLPLGAQYVAHAQKPYRSNQ